MSFGKLYEVDHLFYKFFDIYIEVFCDTCCVLLAVVVPLDHDLVVVVVVSEMMNLNQAFPV